MAMEIRPLHQIRRLISRAAQNQLASRAVHRIGQALAGEPLTIFGDGSQTRSFCFCTDLIDGIFRLSQSDFHEPVNIGNPREMTIKQFAEEIIRITGTRSQIEYRPLPVDDPKVRQPDITRARTVLGWEPRVEFDEGIRKTIEYFRTRID